ncbi:MAG: hypothetical protein KC518_11530 [Candidatus Cloacimonetes bacterium]|nr:hypothetical protein [Candidatus Cloacimonadota bacterium]
MSEPLCHSLREGPWRVLVASGYRAPAVELVRGLPARAVLRDDKRSRVIRLDNLPGMAESAAGLVLKIPRWQDGRFWNRLTTLWREGESRRAFRRALRLQGLGIPAPRPVMQWERRAWGCVVESGWLYEYAQGDPVDERHWPEVIRLLGRLHAAGLAHGDPHLANWIQHQGQVIALDCAPHRSAWPALAAAYDFVLLRNCEPRLEALLPGTHSVWWRLALARDAWVHGLRRLKRWLRGRPAGQ